MDPSFGGKGTMYIDDIGIWGIDNTPETISNFSSIQSEENTISLPAGIYDVSLNVWIAENTTISKFYTIVKKPWINLGWDLSTASKGNWLTLSQTMEVSEDISESPFMIQLSNLAEHGGGKGSFYVDDIYFNYRHGLNTSSPLDFEYNIYPNPTSHLLKIEAEEQVDFVLYSTSGKVVLQSSQKNTQHQVKVSNQKAGMYLLQLKSAKGKVVKPILIQ